MNNNTKPFKIVLSILATVSTLAWAAPTQLNVPIELHSSDSVHRLELPASVILSSQRNDLRDIQIIDAQHKPMPLAWFSIPSPSAQQSEQTFKAYPILGTATQDNTRTQLRISERRGEHGSERVVELSDASPSSAATPKTTIGALLDTRALSEQVHAISIRVDAQVPDGQITPIRISSSENLNDWDEWVVNASVAQFTHSDGRIVQNTIELPARALHKRYVRISWDAGSPIVLSSATFTLQNNSAPSTPPQAIDLSLPQSFVSGAQRHEVSWQLPHQAQLAGIDVQTRTNGLLPMRVYGRSNGQSPWQLLHSTVLFQLTQNGQTHHNSAILMPIDMKELRIQTDPGTQGFPADLQVKLLVAPHQVAFVSSGVAPYSLTILDDNNTLPPALSLSNLMPNYQTGAERQLPTATLAPIPANALALAHNDEPKRAYLLWGALVAGVLLLSFMVFAIWRQMARKDAP